VDGSLMNNSKFCSSAATKFLQVDLGSNQTVGAFVIKHAGLGGENTGYNTGAFTIQTSTDGANWSTAASVSGSRASRTYHPVSARSARYARLNVTTGTARIYEFEVYGGAAGPTNVALNRPATADSQCNANEGPAKAVNGSVGGGNSDKWCSGGSNRWLRVDLGSTRAITSFTVRHAQAGGEDPQWNTRDFDLQVSADGNTWTTVVQARGNTAAVSNHPVTASGRYVRLNVVTPAQDGNSAARIYELEVYA